MVVTVPILDPQGDPPENVSGERRRRLELEAERQIELKEERQARNEKANRRRRKAKPKGSAQRRLYREIAILNAQEWAQKEFGSTPDLPEETPDVPEWSPGSPKPSLTAAELVRVSGRILVELGYNPTEGNFLRLLDMLGVGFGPRPPHPVLNHHLELCRLIYDHDTIPQYETFSGVVCQLARVQYQTAETIAGRSGNDEGDGRAKRSCSPGRGVGK